MQSLANFALITFFRFVALCRNLLWKRPRTTTMAPDVIRPAPECTETPQKHAPLPPSIQSWPSDMNPWPAADDVSDDEEAFLLWF